NAELRRLTSASLERQLEVAFQRIAQDEIAPRLARDVFQMSFVYRPKGAIAGSQRPVGQRRRDRQGTVGSRKRTQRLFGQITLQAGDELTAIRFSRQIEQQASELNAQ